jgi:integrase
MDVIIPNMNQIQMLMFAFQEKDVIGMTQKIKNEYYRQFLDKGEIKLLSEDDIQKALLNVRGRFTNEARALIITLYYTGARPVEALNLKGGSFSKDKHFCKIEVPAAKGGVTRPIWLPLKKGLIKEIYKYATGVYPETYLFFHFRGKYKRSVQTKKGIKERIDISDRLRYYFKKWFKDMPISPYYLRHNRFTKQSEQGWSADDIMQMKGSRTTDSVRMYMHRSAEKGKKMGRKIE